jgi:hypothetical protein
MSLATAEPVAQASKQHGRPKRSWPLLACGAGAVVAAVLAVLVLLDRNASAPDAFPPSLGSVRTVVPVPVGDMYLAAMTADLPDVKVLDAEPIVTADSVAVATEVVACTPLPNMGLMGAGVADIESWCTTQSISGLDLSSLDDGTYLMLVLVPLAAGPVNIDGVDITYSDGRRNGEQRINFDVSLPAS